MPVAAAPGLDDRSHLVRRERVAVVLAAVVLVLFRSLPFALYEQIQFDSDQAIFGLMAMHFSAGRAFPLFLYGSPYVLAVEAWLAAPWFLIAPPSLLTLSISLVLANIATALLMIRGFELAGLRPMHALAASIFFVLAPSPVAGNILSVSGGNVEPFLYIVLLWLLRERPFWFGVTLAIGFLQREFTLYAVPVLLLGDLITGRLRTPAGLRKWLLTMATSLLVWQSVQALQPYADLMGPGTRGDLLRGFAASQMDNLTNQIHLSPTLLATRVDALIRDHMPRILGVHPRTFVAAMLMAALLAGLGRMLLLVWRARRAGRSPAAAAFGWYLLGVGLVASAAYAGMRTVGEAYTRYGLLALLIPTGLSGVLLMLDRREVRRAVVAAAVLWAALSTAQTARLWTIAARAEPSPYRVLADALVARGIRVAYAPYWTAYLVTFMTGERVKIASTDFVRVDEYQRLAAADPAVVEIRDQPCEGGPRVARWYLCPGR